MANILLLDENEVAGRAMQGILARARHHAVIATRADDAWRILREGVAIDLVFMDVKIAGGGIAFLQRLRDDWFWKILPVVIYTSETDTRQVKKALGLKVQNYLIKPYTDALIFAEIAKALNNPWRSLHFEEAKSYCQLLGLPAEELAKLRREVMVGYDRAAREFPAWAEARENEEVFTRVNALAAEAESAGIWGGVDFLRDLLLNAERGNWAAFKTSAEYLDYASRLIFCQLNPSFVPDCLKSDADRAEAKEAVERARWENVDVDKNGPVLEAETIAKQVVALPGCPVIDSVAAVFLMTADGRATSMSQVMDLVANDPGLCAQVIGAANKSESDDLASVEDPATAATLLGEIKLNALAKALPTAPERHFNLPPLTWAQFWMFQVAVGQIAKFICRYLELPYLQDKAGTAGLLHDLGKLLLLRLHPFGFQAIVRYAREKKVPLHVAEKKFLGCTSREMAVQFAEAHGLPEIYREVIRCVESPESAGEHTDVVAIVSLARHVCLVNHVGQCGDTPGDVASPLATTPAWRVIQPRLFPSFDLKKFEHQAHEQCRTLRQDLSGRRRADVLVA